MKHITVLLPRLLCRSAFFQIVLALLISLGNCPTQAQTLDTWGPSATAPVYVVVPQTDGKFLIGGTFQLLNSQVDSYVGRLNTNGSVDTNFNATVTGGGVYCIQLLDDGRILIGGDFSKVAGQIRRRVARLNGDGTLDQTFDGGTNFNAAVTCLSKQGDGTILVGGSFTNLGRPYLTKLQDDGSVDTNFVGSSSGPINCLLPLLDGTIVVGGSFTNLSGSACTNVGRIAANGAFDSGFAASVDGGVTPAVNTLALQRDGKILIGGVFASLNGLVRTNLTRVNADGSADNSFISQADAAVNSLAIQTDGKILVGGAFLSLGGVSRSFLGRVDAAGKFDTSFQPAVTGNYFGSSGVLGVTLQKDGKVLINGYFTAVAGWGEGYVARLNNSSAVSESTGWDGSVATWVRSGPGTEFVKTRFEASADGATWTESGPGTPTVTGWQWIGSGMPTGKTIHARGWAAGGYQNGSSWFTDVYFGQPFFTSQPASSTNLPTTGVIFTAQTIGSSTNSYRWYRNGTPLSNSPKIAGATNLTLRVTNLFGVDAGQYCIVASNSFGAVTSAIANLVVIDPLITNHPIDLALNSGQTGTFSVGAVGTGLKYQWRLDGTDLTDKTNASLSLTNLQASQNGIYDVVVNGTYGSLTSNPARLTVNLVLADSFSMSFTGSVYGIGLQPDRKILIAGNFLNPGLERRLPDGLVDTKFSPTIGRGSYSVSVQDDGKILLAGSLNIARLRANGATDTAFSPQLTNWSQYPSVYVIVQQPNGKIFIGGGFSSATGTGLSLLGPDGVVDTSFSASANDIVYTAAQLPDGKILIGGAFTNINGLRRNYIGRLNSDGTLDPDFDPGANDLVTSMVVQADGKILVAGPFSVLAGRTRNHIGRLNPDGTLDDSFNPNANKNVRSIALQTDGKIIIGGDFTSLGGLTRNFLGRLNADGSVDPNFNPGASTNVFALAIQVDGHVVVGGAFTTLAGKTRSGVGGLINTDPVTQNLTFDNSSIHWFRGGCGPEVWRTSFDYSVDGGDWIKLGEGERIAGGWQLQGLNMPTNASVRARGYIAAGLYQSSGGIIESTAGQLAFSAQPISQTNNAGTSAHFTITAQGVPPLSYQWYSNNVALSDGAGVSGAKTSTLVLSNLNGLNAASYQIVTTNSSGSITSSIATLAVVDPYIWQQPTNYVANGGGTAVLAASAAGANLIYLWLKDGTNLVGKTNNLITVTNTQWSDRGSYQIVVTSLFGSITSAPATLDVILPYPAAFLSKDGGLGFRSNQFGFNFAGNSGQVTVLDGSSNLVEWTPLHTNTNGIGPIFFSDVESSNSPVRFYRLRAP